MFIQLNSTHTGLKTKPIESTADSCHSKSSPIHDIDERPVEPTQSKPAESVPSKSRDCPDGAAVSTADGVLSCIKGISDRSNFHVKCGYDKAVLTKDRRQYQKRPRGEVRLEKTADKPKHRKPAAANDDSNARSGFNDSN